MQNLVKDICVAVERGQIPAARATGLLQTIYILAQATRTRVNQINLGKQIGLLRKDEAELQTRQALLDLFGRCATCLKCNIDQYHLVNVWSPDPAQVASVLSKRIEAVKAAMEKLSV